jgi:hypothetical protein
MAHPKEIGETPAPVGPIRTKFRFLGLILLFHQMLLSNLVQLIGLVLRTLAG